MRKLLISLFDHGGNASKPYRDSGEWDVLQIDIKHGQDILTWDYKAALWNHTGISDTFPQVGIIAMIPCTDYALCGAKWFAEKDKDGRTEFSQKLVAKTKEIIDFFDFQLNILQFWQIENPASRIHKLNPWMGQPRFKFHPFHFAGYDPFPVNSQYGKNTWLWGKFNIPERKELPCLLTGTDRHNKRGGKSEKTKEWRSVTPMGFCNAFYEFNH